MASSYFDRDDTGDYGPSTRRRPPLKQKPKVRNVQVINGENPGRSGFRRAVGYGLFVTLKFENPSSIEYLKSIPDPEPRSSLEIHRNSSMDAEPDTVNLATGALDSRRNCRSRRIRLRAPHERSVYTFRRALLPSNSC